MASTWYGRFEHMDQNDCGPSTWMFREDSQGFDEGRHIVAGPIPPHLHECLGLVLGCADLADLPQPYVVRVVKIGVQNHAMKEGWDLSRNQRNCVKSRLLVPGLEHSIVVSEAGC